MGSEMCIRDSNEGVGDTIIYYDKDGILELRSNAVYTSEEEVMKAPVIRYNKNTDEYQTLGRADIDTDKSRIKANDITSEADGGTRLKGNVEIYDKESDARVFGQEALKLESVTKIFDPGEEQPLLNYRMTSDSLLLRSDSLILSEQYADTDSSFQDLSAVKDVKWKNGTTLGKCGFFKFDQKDSLIVMTDNPILWSDSTPVSYTHLTLPTKA